MVFECKFYFCNSLEVLNSTPCSSPFMRANPILHHPLVASLGSPVLRPMENESESSFSTSLSSLTDPGLASDRNLSSSGLQAYIEGCIRYYMVCSGKLTTQQLAFPRYCCSDSQAAKILLWFKFCFCFFFLCCSFSKCSMLSFFC